MRSALLWVKLGCRSQLDAYTLSSPNDFGLVYPGTAEMYGEKEGGKVWGRGKEGGRGKVERKREGGIEAGQRERHIAGFSVQWLCTGNRIQWTSGISVSFLNTSNQMGPPLPGGLREKWR